MRGPVTSSFHHDIEEAIINEIVATMGVGTSTYPDHPYLLVVHAGRAGGIPEMDVPGEFRPAVFLNYIAGGAKGYEVGGGPLPVDVIEEWSVYGVLTLTSDTLNMVVDPSDFIQLQAYYAACSASIDVFMRRLIHTIINLNLNVTDSILGYVTNRQEIPAWSYTKVAGGGGRVALNCRTLCRLTVMTERT